MTTDAETARRWLLRAELVERYPSLLPRHLAAMADIERTLVTTLAQRMGVDADHDLRPMVVVSAVTALQRSTLAWWNRGGRTRSEEHTSELQSLMRISYAVFCLKKKKTTNIVSKQ